MVDQRLQLRADLKDNASPKIRQLGKELKEIRRTPGMEQASKWMTGFSESAAGFVKDGGGVAGVMGSIGIGGFAAAASLGALVKQLKDLGDHTFAMKKLGQETGLTVDQLNRWEYVGQVFRVPIEQMDAALKTLGDQMVDFRRRRGELFGALNQLDPKFAEKLQLEDTQHQLEDIFGWLNRIPDAAARNRWAKEFFGTDDISALLTNGLPALKAALADAGKNASPITADFQAKADLLNGSVVQFNQAWRNFEVNVGPTVFNELKQAADDFSAIFNGLKETWGWIQAEAHKPAGEIAKDAAGALADKAGEVGDRWKGRAADLARARREVQSEDGNALRRNDEMPVAPRKPGGLFGGLFHQSAYVTGLDGGGGIGGGSASDVMAESVKAGVLAAFREWAEQSALASGGSGGGAAGGFQKAAFTTFGSGGGGFPTAGGGGGAGGGGAPAGIGGSRSWRNNNPGNIEFGPWAQSHGATGSDGRFAIFPDYQAGRKAQEDLLFNSKAYGGLTLGQAIGKWAPGSENNVPAYIAAMHADPNALMSSFSPEQRSALLDAMQAHEGWKVGTRPGLLGAERPGNSPAGVNPVLQAMVKRASEIAGVPLSIYSGLRSAEHNAAVGAAQNSLHMRGLAADLQSPGHLKADSAFWAGVDKAMAQAAAELHQPYRWGGRFGGRFAHDNDHFDLTPGGPSAEALKALPDLVNEAKKASGEAGANGRVDAHIHLHDPAGLVKGSRASGSGSVGTPRLNLERAPMMTQPSFEA